jgi:ribosomal protein S27AE
MEEDWRCRKCGGTLVSRKIVFEYLGHTLSHELPACPRCGIVLIPSDIAGGKMADAETSLEDK